MRTIFILGIGNSLACCKDTVAKILVAVDIKALWLIDFRIEHYISTRLQLIRMISVPLSHVSLRQMIFDFSFEFRYYVSSKIIND